VKNKRAFWSLIVAGGLVMAALTGCATETTGTEEASYDFSIDGGPSTVVARLRGVNLTIDFIDVPED
jgi:hypothetical protein